MDRSEPSQTDIETPAATTVAGDRESVSAEVPLRDSAIRDTTSRDSATRDTATREIVTRETAVRDPALREAALRAANRAPSSLNFGWLWEWAKVFPAAVLLFLVMQKVVVEAYKIPSGSMERTLMVGDFLLVNKLVYGAEIPFSNKHLPSIRAPQRGDIIVFKWPVDPSKNFVKRLVGLPGDTVSMNGGKFVLNGVVQKESYAVHTQPGVDPTNDEFRWQRSHVVNSATMIDANGAVIDTYHPSRNNWGPLVVPPNSFFVLGDNRDNSLDSRYWGFVPDSLLRGKPLMVYYSYVPDSTMSAPWIRRIRWSRLGGSVD